MPDIQSLGPWLRRFFEEYLVTERNLARNTQISYRDTFKLLLSFAADRLRKPVERLDVRDLGAELALVFLAHLEDQRACSPQSRNQRLTALRTFARFVGSRSPAHVEWCAQIRALPFKKSTPRPIEYLEKDEIDALLEAPGRATPQGRRESILLLFLYNTGARADEAAQVRVGDLQQLGEEAKATALVTLRGKRGKQRQCPLWLRTASGLGVCAAENRCDNCRRADDGRTRCRQHSAPTRRTSRCCCRRTCGSGCPKATWRTTSAIWWTAWI